MTETEVVCDAGPLIHLDELSSLDLVADFDRVWIPDVVAHEVERHRPSAIDAPRFHFEVLPTAGATSDTRLASVSHAFSLDAGESAALGLLAQHPDALLLTDDAAARLAAKALGVRSYGTLGVLIRALRRGLRSRAEVTELLQLIPSRSTLFLSREILDEALRQVTTLE